MNEWMNALFVLANIKYQVTVNPLTEAHSKIQWARVILTFGVSAKKWIISYKREGKL